MRQCIDAMNFWLMKVRYPGQVTRREILIWVNVVPYVPCAISIWSVFGKYPLFTEPVNENRAQANPEEVYNLIFSDLKFAADNIPAGAYPKSAAASNDGHITKFAAEALLARVYLFYTGYYGKEPQVEGVTSFGIAGREGFYSL